MSLFIVSVPAFVRTLTSLGNIIDKAKVHCETKKIDPQVLVDARLFPDMFPTSRQIQIACDHAAKACARLTGSEVPTFPDKEKTFDELNQRIASAIDYVKKFKKEQFEGAENRDISVPTRNAALQFKGVQYLTDFAMPNFYFHASMCYAILRHNGVEIGKRDFLGPA